METERVTPEEGTVERRERVEDEVSAAMEWVYLAPIAEIRSTEWGKEVKKRTDRILQALGGERVEGWIVDDMTHPGEGYSAQFDSRGSAERWGDRRATLIIHDSPEQEGEVDYQACRAPYPNPETIGWGARCCRQKGHEGRHAVSQEGLFWDADPEPEGKDEFERGTLHPDTEYGQCTECGQVFGRKLGETWVVCRGCRPDPEPPTESDADRLELLAKHLRQSTINPHDAADSLEGFARRLRTKGGES